MAELPRCEPFAGNPDFYGLGIRIGIYLSWLSSWLTHTLSSDSVPDTHDVNSSFLFAITIAVARSARYTRLRPVELWIMLQFGFGYLCSVLSLLGVRVQLLTPGRAARLVDGLATLVGELEAKAHERRARGGETQQGGRNAASRSRAAGNMEAAAAGRDEGSSPSVAPRGFTLSRLVTHAPSVHTFSFLKHRALSWSGLTWRVLNYASIAAVNIWFWFNHDVLPTSGTCAPIIFFFSRQPLAGKLETFFKTVGIMFAVYAGVVLIFVTYFALKLLHFVHVSYLLGTTHGMLEKLRPRWLRRWEEAKREKMRRGQRGWTRRYARFLHGVSSMAVVLAFAPWLDPDFWTMPRDKIPKLRDLVRAYLRVSTRRTKGDFAGEDDVQDGHRGDIPRTRRLFPLTLCGAMQFWTFACIVYFILSVELTLKWNNITEVNNVDSTGQLIPFVLGVIGFVKGLHELMIDALKEKYPDWDSVKINVDIGSFHWFEIAAETSQEEEECKVDDSGTSPGHL